MPYHNYFTHFLILSPQTYVKGFALDVQKIQKLVGATSDTDPAVERMAFATMKYFVDREKHWLCDALRLDKDEYIVVISLGEGSVGEDLEELKKKDLPTPEYLTKKLSSVVSGPDVFRFMGW